MLPLFSVRITLKFDVVRTIPAVVLAFCVIALAAPAQDTKVVGSNSVGWDPSGQQIPGPACLKREAAVGRRHNSVRSKRA